MIAPTDPNPIIDSGAQVTIGGSLSAAALALAMGSPLVFKPKQTPYMHGWGKNMADSKLAICTWKVQLSDLNDKPFTVTFDIVHGDEPLVIGNNILKHSNHLHS